MWGVYAILYINIHITLLQKKIFRLGKAAHQEAAIFYKRKVYHLAFILCEPVHPHTVLYIK